MTMTGDIEHDEPLPWGPPETHPFTGADLQVLAEQIAGDAVDRIAAFRYAHDKPKVPSPWRYETQQTVEVAVLAVLRERIPTEGVNV